MTEDECVAQLRDAPGDDGRWAVFADLLSARGDVRGELISLALARKSRRERLYRHKHQAALRLHELLGLLEDERASIEWACGHFAALTLEGQKHRRAPGWTWARVVHEVVSHPLAMVLRRVHVAGRMDDDEARAVVDSLVAHGEALTEVTLFPEGAWLRPSALLRLPRLTKLMVSEVTRLEEAAAPRLEELSLFAADRQGRECQLAPLDLPKLRSLALRSWSDTQPAISRWLREGCRALQLRRLALEVRFTSQVIDAVADAPFAKTLERLSVITMDEASADVLLRRRADLPRLTSVTAHHQRVPHAVERRLRAEFPESP